MVRPLVATLALAFASVAFTSFAQADPIGTPDATFGPGGARALGFQPVSNDVQDVAYGACERADSTLNVFGAASGNRRIVTARLLPNGELDTRFSGDGKESFESYAYADFRAAATCTRAGDLVFLREDRLDAANPRLQITRIDGDTGLPDPTFAGGGIVVAPKLLRPDASYALPRQVNELENGELFVVARAILPNRAVALMYRIAPNGTVLASRALDIDGVGITSVAGAGLAPDGTLWVAGSLTSLAGVGTAFRARFDRETLAYLDRPQTLAGVDAVLQSARMVAPGVLAAANAQLVGGRVEPRLVLFRANEFVNLPLPPVQPVMGVEMGTPGGPLMMHVGADGRGRVLLAAKIIERGNVPVDATYVAAVRLRGTSGPDAIDASFGTLGATQLTVPAALGCRRENVVLGLSFWRSRPVVSGLVDSGGCGTPDRDYWVARLTDGTLWNDSFE